MLSRGLAAVVATVVLVGAGVGVYVVTRPETGSAPGRLRVERGSALYAPIAMRARDPRPVTEQEVFGQAATLTSSGVTLRRGQVTVSPDCAGALWGGAATAATGCSRVLRAVFATPDGGVLGQYAVFDMPDAASSDRLVAAFGRAGFLRLAPGQPSSFDAAHSRADARALGHLVVVNWVGPAKEGGAADVIYPEVALEALSAFAQRRVLGAGG